MKISSLKGFIRRAFLKFGGGRSPEREFHSNAYLRHTMRRLEHLASLRIPVSGKSVLEVGAGIGDVSGYYLDRDCDVVITDAREENLKYLRNRYQKSTICYLDVNKPDMPGKNEFEIVHCYGLLYHLARPEVALDYLADVCSEHLFLETCVSMESTDDINLTGENISNPTQAFSGTGCRPTREWIWNKLKDKFEYVYLPITQPNHEEFPLDWRGGGESAKLTRAVFIASRKPLNNPYLVAELLDEQVRCD